MTYPDANLGWKAYLNLGFKATTSKTVLAKRSQQGPLTVQRPFYPEGDICHLYLLHPPGGVVGGDELSIKVSLVEKANVLITTPGATKFYRSGSPKLLGKQAKQIQTLQVANDCTLEWLPQENIFFDNSHSQLTTRIELEENARFMGWEINCYGRPAAQEVFKNGMVKNRFELYREGIPLLLDGLTIGDNNALSSPVSLKQHSCFGTFIATNIDANLRDRVRHAIDDLTDNVTIGITLMDDILIARCLGQYSENVSAVLKKIWMILRKYSLGYDTCSPRIWST